MFNPDFEGLNISELFPSLGKDLGGPSPVQGFVPDQPATARFVLEMSPLQAGLLMTILWRVAGDEIGPRGAVEELTTALEAAGVRPFENGNGFSLHMVDGEIRFDLGFPCQQCI